MSLDAPEITPRTARPRRVWLRMFLAGLTLWLLTVVVTFATGNPNLVPTVVLLGSFLVPVTFVAWAFGHRRSSELTAELLFSTFVAGGVLGVLAASLLEAYLLEPSTLIYVGVGLIEEAVKLAALVVLTRHLARKSVRDGLILGATVGFGFAAFESAGYAFTALFTERGLSLLAVVQTEILRGLLTPVGHGLWTAILGGVLFASSRDGRFRYTTPVLLSYLGVSLLHALWDSTRSIALVVTLLVTGTPAQQRMLGRGAVPRPTDAQVDVLTALSWTGLAVVSLLGVVWLLLLRRHADQRDGRTTAAPPESLSHS